MCMMWYSIRFSLAIVDLYSFFFCKQKTAFEMRISDWSSDVCSSDLVVYLGYSADGRIGRINVTASFYTALGEDRNSFFTSKPAEIRAGFGAVELSYDYDWMRFRLSGLYATGDGDPYNNTEGGLDRKSVV